MRGNSTAALEWQHPALKSVGKGAALSRIKYLRRFSPLGPELAPPTRHEFMGLQLVETMAHALVVWLP
jgi:hypothetical protein